MLASEMFFEGLRKGWCAGADSFMAMLKQGSPWTHGTFGPDSPPHWTSDTEVVRSGEGLGGQDEEVEASAERAAAGFCIDGGSGDYNLWGTCASTGEILALEGRLELPHVCLADYWWKRKVLDSSLVGG